MGDSWLQVVWCVRCCCGRFLVTSCLGCKVLLWGVEAAVFRCFQMQRRETYNKLPLHANFYPMTTQAYLQDANLRFTVLTGQSLGVASLRQGMSADSH